MKTSKLLAMALFVGAIAISCKKEVVGPQGTAGKNGNANVQMYSYSKDTLKGSNNYSLIYAPPGLTSGLLDSSAVFVYFSGGFGEWNMANGFGPDATYITIQYTVPGVNPYIGVYLENPDGSLYSGADVIWDSVRVFIVPANAYKAGMNQKVDFNNYKTASAYFNKE